MFFEFVARSVIGDVELGAIVKQDAAGQIEGIVSDGDFFVLVAGQVAGVVVGVALGGAGRGGYKTLGSIGDIEPANLYGEEDLSQRLILKNLGSWNTCASGSFIKLCK